MSTTLFLRGAGASKIANFNPTAHLLSLTTIRNASINSGINRGLRKSQGVGFRGKDKGRFSRDDDAGSSHRGNDRSVRSRGDSSSGKRLGSENRYNGGGGRFDRESRDGLENSTRGFQGPGGDKPRRSPERFNGHRSNRSSFPKSKFASRDESKPSYGGKSYDSRDGGRPSDRKEFGRKSYETRDEDYGSKSYNGDKAPYERKSIGSRDGGKREYQGKFFNSKDGKPSFDRKPYESRDEGRTKYERKSYNSRDEDQKPGNKYPSLSARPSRPFEPRSGPPIDKPESTFEKKMPITIPYTTPASEFLYGTSVVEAALNARTWKGRKLYKFYIHKGEDRQHAERDGQLAKQAAKKGVEVKEVSGPTWLRTLDKMSHGRPHNGYILEASPLPKLPVTSLAEIIDQDGHSVMKVNLDHQSSEEAAVNGTSNMIRISQDPSGRKPLVLLLDSIEDPQNLGAIIRTASFMGVTAVAISTRNSASFTPVVLKASAGASENMELLSVNKPAGFITDSKAAGWKVYAAVAPPAPKKYDSPSQQTSKITYTDDLHNPLNEHPSILMLGGEGEGLRWNLRSHADVELSIKGAKRTGKLDSLNVSVATGILCDAFMRQSAQRSVEEAVKEVEEETQELGENKIF